MTLKSAVDAMEAVLGYAMLGVVILVLLGKL